MKPIAQENIVELVKLGHERAAELKASCGAVDVRSLAQLISDLATQLEVQLVRGNAQAAQLANAESKLTKSFPVGVRCIHTSKYEKRRCRVVAYDGEVVVVVKMEGGGYFGVPEKSLTIVKDKPEAAQ
ncbi:hypothetical protein [Citrobacter freundii]|uniref:hypothetical protein n=1 Tax=Citrobacter freundii TaxID=546 RepID=UPI002FE68C0C